MSGKQKQSGVVDGAVSSDEILRWTAQRKAAAALEIIKGKPEAPTSPPREATSPATVPPAPRVDPVPPPAPPKEPVAEWASAESPVKQGDIQIKVTSVTVGQVLLTETIGDGEGRSKENLLSIGLEVTNQSETKKLDYRSWGGRAASFGTRTSLTDNFDNRYKVVSFGFSSKVKGATESDSVYPGKAIQDVLVFEEPVGKVEYLNLELPAENFGGTGMMRIRIPVSMIKR
jgi:hypothetical protein